MKQYLLVLFFLFTLICTGFAQGIIKNPAYGMTTSPEVKIVKIELAKKYTAIHFSFVTPANYVFGGWASALDTMYLRDVKTKKRFYLKEAINIPYYPEKHHFTAPGQRLDFVLVFEPVDNVTTIVDMIENIEGGFNFFSIMLIHIALDTMYFPDVKNSKRFYLKEAIDIPYYAQINYS